MATTVLTTIDELQRLQPEWEGLWRRDRNATPFQSPRWLLPWWKYFGSDGVASIAARDAAGTLMALLPLYILRDDESDESLGMFLGTGVSDYLDLIVDASDEGATSAVVNTLTSLDCQVWDFQQLRPSSPLLTAPLPEGWGDAVIEEERCPVLSLVGAGAELENLLSTHFRKKIRYYRRQLEKLGEVTFESVARETLPEMLEALYALHAARWSRRGLPGVLGDDVIQAFHRDAAAGMLDAGALRMYAIRAAGRIVAVFYGFAHQGSVYYYLSGYEPELERFSIGTLLVAHAIEEAVREGATAFDFMRGAEEYKYTWGAVDRMNSRRQLFRS